MRKILIITGIITSLTGAFSQNIGVGVSDPQFKLDVAGTVNLRHVSGSTAGILFDGPTLPARSFMGLIDDSRFGIKSNATNGWPFQLNVTTGHVGIGNVAPAYKLDVKGRLRIRNTGSTAAIWFDGPTIAQTSLIGTVNNDHVGIWGNRGTGWNFVMNVINGNTGIGTSAPTARLDVNGSLRLRSSSPKAGSFLMSNDVSGNAEWVETIAFKATGGYNDEPNTVIDTTSDVWFKMYFHQIAQYNIGAAYQPIQSQFVAPENGIYHFETVLEWENYTGSNRVRLMLNRNGTMYEIANSYKGNMGQGQDYYFGIKQPSRLIADIKLLVGDVVWVEAKAYNMNAPGYPNFSTVSASNIKTWFTGNLVTRIQ